MGSDNQSDILGKKIFFLHPSAAVQNEVVFELIQQEFETYIIQDHEGLKRVLKQYPNSIVFADIDEHMSDADWETWIRGVMNDPETKETLIGIVSANNDEKLQRKYVNGVRVQCGYALIKPDLKSSIKYLLEILKAAEAKGRRKFLRATSDSETLTTINIPFNGGYVNGVIKDISSTGLSCSFAEDPHLEKNSLCPNIQIKLHSTLLKLEGIVFGSRMDGESKVYVVVFTQRIDPAARGKIRKYIQNNMQSKMDNELKQP